MPRLFSKNFLVHLLAKKFQLQIKLKNCLSNMIMTIQFQRRITVSHLEWYLISYGLPHKHSIILVFKLPLDVKKKRNDNLSDRKSFRWPLRNVTYSEDQDQTCFNQGQIHSKYHSNIESPFRAPHHHAQFATFMFFFYFMERGCSVEMIWPFPLIKGLVELKVRGNITEINYFFPI